MAVEQTAALLGRVFPNAPRLANPAYLRWLYEESPFGEVIEANLDDAEGRAGHYALVPAAVTTDGAARAAALSLNTAVDERARGGGVFVRLATESLEQARERGIQLVIGVANANSTPGFLRRLGFELLTPLPATVLFPLPGGRHRVRSAWADSVAYASGGLATDLGRLLAAPQKGMARTWTPSTLRWRLASPDVRYALHRSDRMLVVSTVDRSKGVPVGVLLKTFAASPPTRGEQRAIVRSVCRFHSAPFAVHAGFHEMVAFKGLKLPKRLQASPLNLIVRHLSDVPANNAFARFEFLDFDAY